MQLDGKEYWDLGEFPSSTNQWPRYNEKCLGKITYALFQIGGKILSWHIDSSGYKKGKELVVMQIELPKGTKDEFETLTGFPLSKPPLVGLV